MARDLVKAIGAVDRVINNIQKSKIENLNPRGIRLLSKVLETLKDRNDDVTTKHSFKKERW